MKAKGRFVPLVLGGLLAGSQVWAAVHYVDVNAPPASPQTGISWATAYYTLEPALAAANPGDEIWIADGEYFPDAAPSNIYPLPPGVVIRGGFEGSETNPADRNIAAHPTVISGDLGRDDLNRPTQNPLGDVVGVNAQVLFRSSDSGTFHLDGLTISGANHTNFAIGGGVGGGILLDAETEVVLRIENCRLLGNQALNGGGGADVRGRIEAVDSVLAGNIAGINGGGGLRCISFRARGSSFMGNTTTGAGGGLLVVGGGGTSNIGNTIFVANTAESGGGLATMPDDDVTLRNCTFAANQAVAAETRGSAIYQDGDGYFVTLFNCLFEGNIPSAPTLAIHSDATFPFGIDVQTCQVELGTHTFVDLNGPDNVLGTRDDNPRLAYGSAAIDRGDQAEAPTDLFDADADANVAELIPIDWAGESRVTDVYGMPSQGCTPVADTLIDIGATEYLALPLTLTIIAAPAPAQSRHRVWSLFFNRDVGSTFGEEDLERIGTLAGVSTMAFHRNGATVTVIGIPNDDVSTGTLAPRFDGQVEDNQGGVLTGVIDGSLATIDVLPDCATYYPYMSVY